MLYRALLPFEGDDEDDLEFVNMVSYLPISDKQRIDEIKAETRKGQSLLSLSEAIFKGWPEEKEFGPELTHPYYDMRDELTLQDGLIFKANAVVISKNLCVHMKARIHSSHLGTESCLRRARDASTGPGM